MNIVNRVNLSETVVPIFLHRVLPGVHSLSFLHLGLGGCHFSVFSLASSMMICSADWVTAVLFA